MTKLGSTHRRSFLLAMTTIAGTALAPPSAGNEQRFPDVVAVKVRASGGSLFDFDVTISSPYDTPRRYADGFRVYTSDNLVLGERKLLHDHQDEQPFTRDLYAVRIPPALKKVLVQARDQKYGYGGKVIEVVLPGR
jgi:hypothetical protein